MKKTIVFLSALALAATAYAADKLEAGTASNPNYYVFKAGRGTPYLAYSDDYINYGNGIETRLYRTTALSEANIWEVTPGEAEGTLHISSYGYGPGLMNFIDKDGTSAAMGSVATCVGTVKDIYVTEYADGTVSLCLNSTQGWEQIRDGETTITYYYALDASGGSDFCGNWVPNDAGTKWSAYKLDLTDGADVALAKLQDEMLKEAGQAKVQEYIGSFQAYIESVPWVADELKAGIEELKNLEIKAGYDTIIPQIWQTACNNANNKLSTVFDGKTLAIRNIAEMNAGFKSNTLAVDTVADKFVGLDGFSDPTATFVFKAVDGGYTIFNEATKTYLSNFNDPNYGCKPTTVAEEAQVIYPVLWTKDVPGIALPIANPYSEGTPGVNMQPRESTKVSYWRLDGDCPVWSIVAADEEAQVTAAIEGGLASLKPYVENVPDMIAMILTDAISTLEGMDAATVKVDDVTSTVETAIATANEALAGAMNGISLSLRNLRQNKFITVTDGAWDYSLYNDIPETTFSFKTHADGGYILHNEAAGVYVGNAEVVDQESNVLVATEEADAMPVYPFLCTGGDFAGVALAIEANPTSQSPALNTNNSASNIFHTYRAYDAGSIFALLAPNTVVNSINEVSAAPVKIQGIYDLSGRKLSAPVKGINIINGRKVLVR